jgi:hypothetical protein
MAFWKIPMGVEIFLEQDLAGCLDAHHDWVSDETGAILDELQEEVEASLTWRWFIRLHLLVTSSFVIHRFAP